MNTIVGTAKKQLLIIAMALSVLCTAASALADPAPPVMDISQTLSDGAQQTTLAFDGLAMMTGNLDAQSFFPPGKVTIKLKSGDAYTRQIDFPFGHPRNPMSPQDVINKFKDFFICLLIHLFFNV